MSNYLKKSSIQLSDPQSYSQEVSITWGDKHVVRLAEIKKAHLPKLLKFKEVTGRKVIGEVYQGENLTIMNSLLDRYEGKVDLIYLDPPFKTGKDFLTTRGNEKKLAYSDKFRRGEKSYWQFIWERLQLAYYLLSPKGSLYLHTDYRTASHLKLMLLELFGEQNYINEIIWAYKTGGNSKKLGFARKHDTIHFCAKNREIVNWSQMKDKSYLTHRYGFKNIKLQEDKDGVFNLVSMRDVWELPALRGNQPERVDYPTQKPLALLERIITASSCKGDLVADFFGGSGTTAVAAKRLGRRYLLIDQGTTAVNCAIQRLKHLE